MDKMYKTTIYILLFFSLLSCGGGGVTRNGAQLVGDTLSLSSSLLLQIVEGDGFSLVNIRNPWDQERLLHSYMLVHRDCTNVVAPSGVTMLRTPLRNQLLFATLHAQLLVMLGCGDAVTGVCDARYMSIPEINEGIADGRIVDCGSSMDVNLERLAQLSPEAAWVIPFKNGGYGKLDRLDIPLIECVDYMEDSPLGAAEWVRFYGRLLGVGAKADSLFFAVRDRYEAMKALAAGCEKRPRLMCELKNGAAWYVPGGASTMGQLYRDAGAHYLFGDNNSSGSLPLSFETVLAMADSADCWLIKYGSDKDKTYSSLLQDFSGYRLLRPYREENIYACNVFRKRFYEETPFRPDILLEELVMLLHPELADGYQFRYYEKLQK